MTGEPFTSKEILTLQDPKNLANRSIKNFDFIKRGIEMEMKEQGDEAFINKNDATKNVLNKYLEV